jgi:pyruvate carboxylase subunit B
MMNNYIVTFSDNKKEVELIEKNKMVSENVSTEFEIEEIDKYFYIVKINGRVFPISLAKNGGEKITLLSDGKYIDTIVRTELQEKAHEHRMKSGGSKKMNLIKAPMPGLLLKLHKKVGDAVESGEALFILEAMKMENEIKSPISGTIKEVYANEGNSLEKDAKILFIE